MSMAWNGRGNHGAGRKANKSGSRANFWLFFMLAALQPVITQRLLEASRKRLIGRIERGRKSRVVLLVHRQETMSLLGFPVFRYIDVDDSEQVIRAIHLIDPGPRPGAAHAGRFGTGSNSNCACCP
jgi:ClpP class serine protease